MKTRFLLLLIASVGLLFGRVSAQSNQLKPGFEKSEYLEMLRVGAGHIDSVTIDPPQGYKKVYRSPVVGLDNRWELWQGNNGVAVISIRGTTLDPLGWIENFYAAMVPATGQIQLSANEPFSYKLAKNPRAAVHAGWLIGMAYLAKDILPKMDSCIQKGTKEFMITGISQGGAITFLMTSYLSNLRGNRLPADLRFKTYSIAAPKPGNLSYAYDYEVLTQSGWAFNVVNSADWVPEFPLTVQTTDDFNLTNPVTTIRKAIRNQKFLNRVMFNYVFNKMDKPSRKAQKQYQRFLGNYISKAVRKNLPDYQKPTYFPSSHFMRAGQTIVLDADEVYFRQFPADPKKLLQNHLLNPYLFLGNRLK
ncbi:lipase family protein [Larkinella sp. GY13]|uniref:lipase family protein n=1 Tax=Larkinella sp. GY13 TaxID=3453720 RepID=UPI003EEB6001